MIKTKTFILASLAIATIGTGSSAWYRYQSAGSGPRVAASWAFKASSLEQLRDHADIIVVAEAGDSFFHRSAYSDGTLADQIPFELVELNVQSAIKGAQVGEQLLVERAGGMDIDGRYRTFDLDGGAFEKGQTYLLFLNRQEEGEYLYQVNDQARFTLAKGRLAPIEAHEMEHDPVASALRGMSMAQAMEALSAR